MIDGVGVVALKRIPDERGCVQHMLKSSDPHFREFGEIYFSSIYPGVIKGWHLHSRMTINYSCIVGNIKLVLFDAREKSKTKGEIQVVYLGVKNPVLVTVPPGIWNGFMNVDVIESMVANCATIPHDPTEVTRMDPRDPAIPYDWTRKDC